MYTIDSRQTPITIAYLPKTSGAKYTIRYTLADTVADAMQACEHEIGEFGLGHQLLMESQQG